MVHSKRKLTGTVLTAALMVLLACLLLADAAVIGMPKGMGGRIHQLVGDGPDAERARLCSTASMASRDATVDGRSFGSGGPRRLCRDAVGQSGGRGRQRRQMWRAVWIGVAVGLLFLFRQTDWTVLCWWISYYVIHPMLLIWIALGLLRAAASAVLGVAIADIRRLNPTLIAFGAGAAAQVVGIAIVAIGGASYSQPDPA